MGMKSKLALSMNTAVGIELNTELLHSIETDSTDSDHPTSAANKLATLLHSLYANAGLNVLVIAINSYTYTAASHISLKCRQLSTQCSRNKDSAPISIVAVDIFRAHPRRPGLFCCEDISVLPSLSVAVDELKRSMDSCMALERQYIEKVCNFDARLIVPF